MYQNIYLTIGTSFVTLLVLLVSLCHEERDQMLLKDLFNCFGRLHLLSIRFNGTPPVSR